MMIDQYEPLDVGVAYFQTIPKTLHPGLLAMSDLWIVRDEARGHDL